MPIFSRGEDRVLFAHVPKTAGSSVAVWFLGNGWQISNLIVGDEDGLADYMRANHGVDRFRCEGRQPKDVPPQHATIEVSAEWGDFTYRFAIVRHPVARYCSQVKYAAQLHFAEHGQTPGEELFGWFCQGYHSAILEHIGEMPHLQDNHLRPQTDFVDQRFHIFKLEDAAWRNVLGDKFDLTGAPPVLNTSDFPHDWVMPLDDAARAWIFEYYAKDFERFGYAEDLPGVTG